MNRFVIIAFACCFASYGCGSGNKAGDSGDITLMVSISPLRDVVRNITGDDFKIDVLVPDGASPETYEPTPSQMISVDGCRALFVTGLIDFEKQLAEKIKRQGSSGGKVVELHENIRLIKGECTEDAHNHGVDPHIWSSPRCLKVMAANAYRAIALLYPDSTKYRTAYEGFTERLDSLDKEIETLISASGIEYFIIYHPALTYYARDYGIEQISLEEDGKEPSADNIKKIILRARRDGVKNIFYQKQFSPATVEVVVNELGGSAVEIDPLREDVISNLLEITRKITGDAAH